MSTQQCFSYLGYSVFCDSRVAFAIALVVGLLVGFLLMRFARRVLAISIAIASGVVAFVLMVPAGGLDSEPSASCPAGCDGLAGGLLPSDL